jgi:uncharacterized protein
MTDEEIRQIFEGAKTVAIVGISDRPERESFRVGSFLMQQGYRVLPINPNVDQILGLRVLPSLRDVDEPVDIVDIFRRSEAVLPVVEDAIAVGAKVIWMQEGVVNEEAARRAEDAGLQVVMDRCVRTEYKRLMGEGAHFAEGML